MGSYAAWKARQADVSVESMKAWSARVTELKARVEELEAALDLALGHMRHEDDCAWTVGLRGGQGLSQGGPGVECNCGNRDAVRRVSKLLRTGA